jgi:hypothetical protein
MITISKAILDGFELLNKSYLVNPDYYELPSGQQEYRLYSYLTTFFNNCKILDIGTLDGRSAIAFSHNQFNKVISYDIVDHIKDPDHKIYTKNNVEFRLNDVMDDLTSEFIQDVKIIMIDIDHLETIEEKILKKLQELNYSGIILLDDIHHPDLVMRNAMERLWSRIPYEKFDITDFAHWSGTGLVLMNTDVQVDIVR